MRTKLKLALLLIAAGRAADLTPGKAPGLPSARGTIDYLRTIDSVREYSKPKSFFGRLGEWIAGPPEDMPQLLRPYGLTHDSVGRLLVADPGQRVVHIFDFERHKYDCIKGAKRQPFLSPVGIATDAADNVYVSDSARGSIYVFDRKKKLQRTLNKVFQRPTGLALDARRGLLYVADTLRHQILVLGLDGTLRQSIGRRGRGPGEFNFPTALALAGGTLYVVDAMNFRIQALALDGKFLRAFGRLGDRTGTLNRPKGIALDSDGHLYVVDAMFDTVQIFDPEGRLLDYFGTGGKGPGEFSLPAGIYIDPRDRIWVADSYNRRVQVFRYRREGS